LLLASSRGIFSTSKALQTEQYSAVFFRFEACQYSADINERDVENMEFGFHSQSVHQSILDGFYL